MKTLLTINPKELGTTIEIGKLPVFTKSLDAFADMDSIVQIVIEGGYYAVEKRTKKTAPKEEKDDIESILERLADRAGGGYVGVSVPDHGRAAEERKTDVEEAKTRTGMSEKKFEGELEKLGFTNLKPSTTPTETDGYNIPANEQRDYAGRPVSRCGLPLFKWLKSNDYVVYKMFVTGHGDADMGKKITRSDIVNLFVSEGLPSIKSKAPAGKGATAERVANGVIAQLLRTKVLQKEIDGQEPVYSLSVVKGGQYARSVYATVSAGSYIWNGQQRVLRH